MADGLAEFPSLATIGPTSLGGSEGHLSFGEDDPEFVSDADRQRFQCPVHKGLLHDTRQTPCGHRLCGRCVAVWLNGASSKPCPVGESDCEDITETNVHKDKSVQRDMKNVPVYCKNKHEGCPLQMPFKNYRTHLDECAFQRVPCEHAARGCKERVLRGKVKEHQQTCPFRPVRCKLCRAEINHNQREDHDNNDCAEKVTGCPFGCDNKTLKRKEIMDHRDVCPKHPIDCKFKHMGCKFVAEKEVVEKHEREGLALHLDLVMARVAQVQEESQARTRDFPDLKGLEERLQSSMEHQNKTSAGIQNLEKEMKEMKLRLVSTLEKVIIVERKIPDLVERPRLDAMEQTVRGVQQRVTQLEQRTERETPQQGSSAGFGAGLRNNVPVARYGNVENMAETVHTQLGAHDRQLQMHDVRMAEMDLRFQLLETASYDGTLIWKIKDYAQRKSDAVNGRTLSLYSQPFYTHRFGYKMCARVYLNGDGMGKTTHLSLFFVVMRGEYDALLSWPFRRKVTLSLLDQSPEKRHLSDHFIPDPNSSSFRKPVAEMNVASGCPLFVSHSALENRNNSFLKDDTIFIRIVVDPDTDPAA